MTAAVALFAKAPTPGAVKTRLSPPLSPEDAALVARACIRETVTRFGAIPAMPVTLFYDGPLDDALVPWARTRGVPTQPQTSGDLTTRLKEALGSLFAGGAARAIAIGSDSPTLPVERLREAADALRTHDAVIGPAEDGGYYLIGFARPDFRLLEDIPWSTPDVTRTTLERAAAIGARAAVLERWYDIDDVASLRRALADAPPEGEFRQALRRIEERLGDGGSMLGGYAAPL